MNIVLESAVEIIGGQPVRNYGRVLLRGINIMYVI
jgi:small nuclear ribonucleoprotein (snRNP)-like protein